MKKYIILQIEPLHGNEARTLFVGQYLFPIAKLTCHFYYFSPF